MLIMRSKQSVRTCIMTICLVQLAISTSCMSAEDHRISKTITPGYTPIVMIAEGTTLPSDGTLVSIEDLAAHPQQYADQFIEVRGFNEGTFAIPACSPYYGPLDHWGLAAALTNYHNFVAESYPPIIEVKNTFGGVVSDWGTIRNTMEKKAAVWGWWRLYEDPIGCGQIDPQGTPIPPTMMPNQQSWYLDAVKLQWLESIEVTLPEN
jgi:hypothetical protein